MYNTYYIVHLYRFHVQHSIHSTVCTDLMYNTVYIVQYVQIYVQYSIHFTVCTDLMYNTVYIVQYVQIYVQHSTHCTVCTGSTLSLTSQVKVKKWHQMLYQTEKRNRRQIVTFATYVCICWGMRYVHVHPYGTYSLPF